MTDRLFKLAQQIERLRQQTQGDFSEATSYEEEDLQDNRLLALQQSLTSSQFGYGLEFDLNIDEEPQPNLSEASYYADNSPQLNRLLALEQSLISFQQMGYGFDFSPNQDEMSHLNYSDISMQMGILFKEQSSGSPNTFKIDDLIDQLNNWENQVLFKPELDKKKWLREINKVLQEDGQQQLYVENPNNLIEFKVTRLKELPNENFWLIQDKFNHLYKIQKNPQNLSIELYETSDTEKWVPEEDAPYVANQLYKNKSETSVEQALKILKTADAMYLYKPVRDLVLTGKVLNPEGFVTAINECYAKAREKGSQANIGIVREILYALAQANKGNYVQLGGWKPDHLVDFLTSNYQQDGGIQTYAKKLDSEGLPIRKTWGGDTVVWTLKGNQPAIETVQHKVLTTSKTSGFNNELKKAIYQLAGHETEVCLPDSNKVADIVITDSENLLNDQKPNEIELQLQEFFQKNVFRKRNISHWVDKVRITTKGRKVIFKISENKIITINEDTTLEMLNKFTSKPQAQELITKQKAKHSSDKTKYDEAKEALNEAVTDIQVNNCLLQKSVQDKNLSELLEVGKQAAAIQVEINGITLQKKGRNKTTKGSQKPTSEETQNSRKLETLNQQLKGMLTKVQELSRMRAKTKQELQQVWLNSAQNANFKMTIEKYEQMVKENKKLDEAKEKLIKLKTNSQYQNYWNEFDKLNDKQLLRRLSRQSFR